MNFRKIFVISSICRRLAVILVLGRPGVVVLRWAKAECAVITFTSVTYVIARHALSNRLQCSIVLVRVIFLASSAACSKKCDQSTNEEQCDNAANNATDQSSVVVRRLSGRSCNTGCSIRGRRCLAYNRQACRWRRRCRRERRRHRRQGQHLRGGGRCCGTRPHHARALGGRIRQAILLRTSTSEVPIV
jgi:hypothetical protein